MVEEDLSPHQTPWNKIWAYCEQSTFALISFFLCDSLLEVDCQRHMQNLISALR